MLSESEKLVERARNGDQVATVELVEGFYQPIYGFLRRLSSNDEDAADLTQRTFGRLWQSLPTFKGRSSFGSWFYGIAYHVYLDWRRANHRTETRSEQWWDGQICPEPTPDEIVLRGDLAARLFTMVDKLDPDLRDTIHLHYYQQLTLQETAQAMGIATSTVKYRLRQALQELGATFESPPVPTASRPNYGNL